MQYNIQTTGLTLSEEIRNYIEKELAHTEKFLQGKKTVQVDVELHYAEGESEAKYNAVFNILIDGDLITARAHGQALHEAIDIAGGEIARELSHRKDKKMRLFKRGAIRIKEIVRGWRN